MTYEADTEAIRALENALRLSPADPAPARAWQGIPLVGPRELARRAAEWRGAGSLLLGAAAVRGARERIRGILSGLRLVEGRDFLMLA